MGPITSLAQYKQTKDAGEIAQGEARVSAAQEETAAAGREADRKSALARAIASQNASGGARGIASFEGSSLAVMKEDTRRAKEDRQRDAFSTKLAADSLRMKGSIAKKQARTSANIGLLTDIMKMASTGGGATVEESVPQGGTTKNWTK
jgi:hypothetical protein